MTGDEKTPRAVAGAIARGEGEISNRAGSGAFPKGRVYEKESPMKSGNPVSGICKNEMITGSNKSMSKVRIEQ